jgi:hypothetical protein
MQSIQKEENNRFYLFDEKNFNENMSKTMGKSQMEIL